MPKRAISPGRAMALGPVDAEIRLRLAGAVQLGPDAGVVRRKRAVRQARPEVADVVVEARRAGRIDAVVRVIHEFEVRAEMRPPAEVALVVQAQRPDDRRRIDQVMERRLTVEHEVDALAVVELGDLIGGIAFDLGRRSLGPERGGDDEAAHGQGSGLGAADAQGEAAARQGFGPLERRVHRHRPTARLDLALQGQHVAVGVEDAGLGRQQAHQGAGLRLQRMHLLGRQHLQTLDAVDLGLSGHALHAGDLGLAGGHDDLAALVIGDAVRVEERVHQAPAGHAQLGFQRTGGIVEAAVDHLGIARGDALADEMLAFQHQHIVAALGQGVAAGQAHGAGADDGGIEIELGRHADPYLG
jgi:hypothetical protein